MKVIEHGVLDHVTSLLNAKASVNIACHMGRTALHYAAGAKDPTEYPRPKIPRLSPSQLDEAIALTAGAKSVLTEPNRYIVRQLLAFGARPNYPDYAGNTPLHLAPTLQVGVMLLQNGACKYVI